MIGGPIPLDAPDLVRALGTSLISQRPAVEVPDLNSL
jgi:hypothetical protein